MADAVSGGVSSFADAMKKLPPIAQELVMAILALEPAWKRMKIAAANATLPGFIVFVEKLDLCHGRPAVRLGGGRWFYQVDFMIDLTKLVTGGEWQSFFRFLGDQSAEEVMSLAELFLIMPKGCGTSSSTSTP